MFLNWILTVVLWLTLLIELWKIDKHLKGEDEEGIPMWLWIFFGVIFTLAGVLHGAYTLLIPIHIYLLWALIARGIIYWIGNIITAKEPFAKTKKLLGKREETSWGTEYSYSGKRVVSVIVLIVILLVAFFIFVPRSIGYWQATTFKGSIDGFKTGSIAMFPEVNPDDLRVTTPEIARSIAEIKRTSAESFVTSVHLGMYKDKLVWACTVSEKPWLGMLVGGSNRIREVIVIPVNDATGEKSEVVPFRGIYSEGLWFAQDIRVHANDIFPTRTFSRGYITSMGDKLVIVTTSYIEIPFGPLVDPRIHVWDPVTGDLIAEYTPYNAPDWIIQRWDEDYLAAMGDSFGDYRWTAQSDLNYWNGLPRFSDRSADPSEPGGLRYQLWNGRLTAVYLFDNKRNEQVLEMIIVATNKNLTLYSVDNLGLLSPDDAKELAITGLPALPEDRSYSTPIALIYRVESRLFYHIPIYIKSGEHYYPAYFALVDCESRTLLREETGKYGGMIQTVKALYGVVSGKIPVKERTVNGTLVGKEEWVRSGNTRVWLTIKINETNNVGVLAKAELLSPEEMHILLDKQIGQMISVKADENNVVIKVLS